MANRDAGSKGTPKGQKPKWKIQPVGGHDLQWDPYGQKTLERFATQEEYDEFQRRKRYSVVNYGGSRDKAIWFKTAGGEYDADFAARRPWKVVIYVDITQQTPLIHAESGEFEGEAGHPDKVIVKNNENGAYGIGRSLIDKLKPEWQENR